MDQLAHKLRAEYPDIQFIVGDRASWSPNQRIITIPTHDTMSSQWALLHELGHALLNHTSFQSDIQLLSKERDAWLKAQEIGTLSNIQIPADHIEECLDTYRDWLHKRSTCPSCSMHGLQKTQRLYSCFNCAASWKVSLNRFCRSYRLSVHN